MKNISTIVPNPLLKYLRTDLPGRFNEINVLKTHKERFLRVLRTGDILPPYEVLIHPSSVCNQKCEWCIGGKILEEEGKNNKDILANSLSNPKNMEKVIEGILNYQKDGFRIENVSFSGITGEPFMSKKSFMLAIEMLSKYQIRTGVFSNGGLIDDDLIKILLKMNYINVSLDAITPETFIALKYGNRSCGKIVFSKIIKNITTLAVLKKETGSNLDINASFVLYPDNYHEIFEAAKVLKSLGVSNLRIKQDISRKKLLSEKQKIEAEDLIANAKKLEDDNFKFIVIHRINVPSDMERGFQTCTVSDLIASIGSDGNVYPCNYQCHKDSPFYGNAIEKSFKDIWEGERRKEVKMRLPSICSANCDPFKNRSNRLFQIIKDTYEDYGNEVAEKFIQEIIEFKEGSIYV